MDPKINDLTGKGRRLSNDLEEEFDNDMEEEEPIEFDKFVSHKISGQEKEQLPEDEEVGDVPLEVDFLFLDPNQSQFFSVKSLLNGYLDGMSYRSSDLANIICDQVVVGTMIGVEGDDEKPNEKNVLGFGSVLNLQVYEEQMVMKEIIKFVVSKSEVHNARHQEFLELLQSQTNRIGLLVNERMINLSPQLVPTLHAQLCEDINWIKEEKTDDSEAFNLKYLLCLSKCYKDPKQPKKKVKQTFDNYIFQKFEDYSFLQRSLFHFAFQAHSSKNMSGLTSLETVKEEEICERLIYLISYSDYVECVQNLGSYLM